MNYTLSADNTSITFDGTKLAAEDSPLFGKSLTLEAITHQTLRIHTKKLHVHDSYAIEKLPTAKGSFRIEEKDGFVFLYTEYLCIRVDNALFIDIYDADGKLLCADYTGSVPAPETMTPQERDQLAQEGHVVPEENRSYSYQVRKALSDGECIYGLGDKTGFLNKRGYDYMMWNSDLPHPHVENPTFKALYKSIPFFMVHCTEYSYGIFADNPHKSFFDMGYEDNAYYCFSATAGEMDYFFMSGTLPEIIASYTELTGRAPLPQLWTLGYHQSRWSYSTQDEVLSVAQHFRKNNIPCDAIHLDIDYMEDFKVFTNDNDRFPNLTVLSDRLNDMGIKLVTIIDPGVKVETGYPLYEEGIQKGYFAMTSDGDVYENKVWPGDSVFPDFTSEAVRQWWGDQITFQMKHQIRGIWNDMNEPASFNGPLPDDVVFPGDPDTASLTHSDVHNVYGHLMAKATYEGWKRLDSKRPFVITRACYSGSQKYSTAWTGDNQSLWSHLKMSIPQLLNLGMSGMPLIGTDIGGFGANTTPELLCRWIQASCFAPLFRNHSAKYTRRQEPWQFDETTLEIYRKYVDLRYRFIPYMYDLCYEETVTGLPLLRPLVLHYPKDPAVFECNDEYLVGDRVLVAPITDQGARSRAVYLPEGEWVDYWTGVRIEGGKYILREAPPDMCPMYILSGSIIPNYPAMQSIEPDNIDTLRLLVYPDSQGNVSPYRHYQDNGEDFQYEQGSYNLYEFHLDGEKNIAVKNLHTGYSPYKEIDIDWR
ncbi:MAG: DUF4968 domain-containing protein [Lachnospiraceae bacterium]|nr:DUF4968 domain-containing protein [Lachnospiraceae bacterium]